MKIFSGMKSVNTKTPKTPDSVHTDTIMQATRFEFEATDMVVHIVAK